MRDLRTNSAEALLRLHYNVLDELKARGIIRSACAPIGEYAEVLFCEAFAWDRVERNANAGFDATDKAGNRIQIKARRVVGPKSRQLGAMRNLERRPFDQLAAVLFARNLEVARAAIIPLEVVRARALHDRYTNSYKLMLDDDVWALPGVEDVTRQIQLTASAQL